MIKKEFLFFINLIFSSTFSTPPTYKIVKGASALVPGMIIWVKHVITGTDDQNSSDSDSDDKKCSRWVVK